MKNNTSITLVKLIHSAIWLVMVIAIFYILYAGITGDMNSILYIAVGLIVFETIVLLMNRGACPLTTVAKRVKKDWRDGDDIFLPKWVAIHNKKIFGTLFAIGIILVVYRMVLG